MIAYNSNARQVLDVVSGSILKMQSKEENDKLLRTIASTLTAQMAKRVHKDGLDANEQPIGTYSKSYMVVRTGAYKNADTYSKGKNKGKNKNAGTYTKFGLKVSKSKSFFINIEKEAINRKAYNRTSDTKVILSLTRQMENDLSICVQNPIQTSYGYAIGYQNDFNYDKLIWNEKRYKKLILSKLSPSEEKTIDLIVNNAIENVKPNN